MELPRSAYCSSFLILWRNAFSNKFWRLKHISLFQAFYWESPRQFPHSKERFILYRAAPLARVHQILFFYVRFSSGHSNQNYAVQRFANKLRGETEVASSSRVSEIAFRCGNTFSLKDKNSMFVFGLLPAMQTIVANKTDKLDDRRWPFENVIPIAIKLGEVYCVRPTKPAVRREAFYVSTRSD